LIFILSPLKILCVGGAAVTGTWFSIISLLKRVSGRQFKGACFAVTVRIEPSKFDRQRNTPAGDCAPN
jgi:hypothetical protein